MRLLDRYLLRELLLPLGYCLGGFLIFWISFDLIGRVDNFQESHLRVADIAEYYLVTSPEFLREVMPIALLLALLYTLTTHARHNELTAMRAAGLSLWRIAAPYFAVGLFFTVAYFALNELWLPKSAAQAEEIMLRHASSSDPVNSDWRQVQFTNHRDNRDWVIKAYNAKTSQMQGALVNWTLPDGQRRFIYAQRANFSDGIWKFADVEIVSYVSPQDFTPTKTVTNLLELAGWIETPELIKSEIKISGLNSKKATKRPQLSIAEILNYLQIHPRLDKTTRAMVNTLLHDRIAAPWTCLVVVLIALPFGAPSGRRNVFVGVASSIFICFSYFILLRVGLVLGTSGRLPAPLAAWLPNILFSASAIWMIIRVR